MKTVDFRSDTVTKPSPEMWEVVKSLDNTNLGDDVLREDPKVNELEEKAAKILKKTAKKKRERILTPEEIKKIEEKKIQKQKELEKRKKEKEKIEKIRIKKEAKKIVQQMREKQKSKIEKEVNRKVKLRLQEETKKIIDDIKEKERLKIEKQVRDDIEKKSLAKLKKNLKQLTRRIETLQKEKTTLLQNKATFLEALNFNCPHCKNSCVVYQEGNRYFVKRSAKVTMIPKKAQIHNTSQSLPTPKGPKN